MICNLIINEGCTPRYTSGRETFSKPAAIVLVALEHNTEQYATMVNTPIARWYPTTYPKSVHYVVSANGAVTRYVGDQDTAWGIDELHNPAWPGVQAATDPAAQFLFVGLEWGGLLTNSSKAALARLICCLATEHHLVMDETTIIVARDLDDRIDTLWSVPDNLIALAISECLGGMATHDLVRCCEDNTAAIEALDGRVTDLEGQLEALTDTGGPLDDLNDRVLALELAVASLTGRVLALEGQQAGIAGQFAALGDIVNAHQVCIDRVCPPPSHYEAIEYYATNAGFTALAPNWLNLQIKVSDTVPASVTVGPAWVASVSAPGTYTIQARVRFAVGNWCVGKQAWLDLVVNGAPIRLATYNLAVSGTQTVDLYGMTVITAPPALAMHLNAQTDDNTTLSRIIDYAWIKIQGVAP